MINVITISIPLIMVILLYISYRNNKVYNFRNEIIHHCFGVVISFLESLKDDAEFHKQYSQYEILRKKADKIINKYSYTSMLLSFKPLKLESWLTKEEIDFMNLKTQKEE